MPEEIFYLLCAGELPDAAALASLQEDLRQRAAVPAYVWNVLEAMTGDAHPMTMFSTAILVMEHESEFDRQYHNGLRKDSYWEPTLEDSLRILARLPAIAAGIYRLHTRRGPRIPSNPKLDWAADYAHMLGLPETSGEFANLMRLYLTLHCDHESGNVSAMTSHTVGSALSNAFHALSAGLNGLAGPLHGLANQECLKFVVDLREKFHGPPTDEQLSKFAWDTLKSGQVIPGYGHAVLRITDPRFTAFHQFGTRVCPQDDIFRIMDRIYAIVPGILKEQGKAKDPWPNVDAISGALLYHFGLTEYAYYTVLFGVSRALGLCSQLILSRALGSPIFRPKSVTTQWIKNAVAKAVAKA